MELTQISDQLQNPETEGDRMLAYQALRDYVIEHPESEDARNLYLKYRDLGRDWTKATVSTVS